MYNAKCTECTDTSLCPKCLQITDGLKIGNKESSDSSEDESSSEESEDESEDEMDDELEDESKNKEPDELDIEIDDSTSILYNQSTDIPSSDIKYSSINRRIIVDPDKRITSNVITQLEIARAISIRAANIDAKGHDNSFIDTKGYDSACEIAKKEFYSRRSPLKLLRYVGNNEWEEFLVREMTFK